MKTIAARFLVLFFLHSIYTYAAPAGYVIAWGSAPGSESQSSPNVVVIAGQVLTNATSLAAGNGYALAVRSDSTVVGWGWNNHGQATGVPTADQTNGVVTLNGEAVSNVVAVSAEWLPVMALKSDGSVIGWGGKWTNASFTNIVSICGRYHLGIKADGTVVDVFNSQTVEGLSNVMAIVTSPDENGPGGGAMVVLKKDGTIMSGRLHGVTPFSQIQGISNATAIAAGQARNVALKKDRTVVGWGYANDVPAGISNVVAISVGGNSLALKNDGTVLAWGSIGFQPAIVPEGLSNVVAIAAGPGYCLAITTNRAVAEKFMH